MNHVSRRQFFHRCAAAGASIWAAAANRPSRADQAVAAPDAFPQAEASARIAGYSFSKVQRWLHEKALPLIDAETGLYRADGRWNYRDTAADCYPFLCWAAHVVDQDALHGPVLEVLRAEQRLCNHVDRIPVRFDWNRKQRDVTTTYDEYIFGASEYVKDGLVAIVEVTGKGPWYERMKGIEEDVWKHARVETPHGKIPSTNVEVNGEQIQALVRLFTMSGEARFLRWAERLADHYLSDEDYVPTRLRDHGCEIIGGLGLLLGVESEVNPAKAEAYASRLATMFDAILARGVNSDGIMFNTLGNPNSGLSDGWGYDYVGFLCHDMATGQRRYETPIQRTLVHLAKPVYRDYPWEGRSIDGYADSIEGAIYLLNRIPTPEGFAWVDREMARNVVRSHEPLSSAELWGTMKLESNGVRTTIMHALMHTQGLIARPWRADLKLGAARGGDGTLAVLLAGDEPWTGRVEFDVPRHRVQMGFQRDWPRMNTLPEWFTVEPQKSYRIRHLDGEEHTRTGRQLAQGLAAELNAGEVLKLTITEA